MTARACRWSGVCLDRLGRQVNRQGIHAILLSPLYPYQSTGVVTKEDVALLKEEVCGLDSFYVTGAWIRE